MKSTMLVGRLGVRNFASQDLIFVCASIVDVLRRFAENVIFPCKHTCIAEIPGKLGHPTAAEGRPQLVQLELRAHAERLSPKRKGG